MTNALGSHLYNSHLYRLPGDPTTETEVQTYDVCRPTPPPVPRPKTAPAPFQDRVMRWARECFGDEIVYDRRERNHRFVEEALELAQSLDCTADEAHQLVDYVFGRPVGDPYQEVGGVVVTLAALCGAAGLTMSEAAEYELARVWKKIDQIREKQATKPKHSPLPGNAGAPSVLVAYGRDDAEVLADGPLPGAFVALRLRTIIFGASNEEAKNNATWIAVVGAEIERAGGTVTVADLYRALADHPKAGRTNHLREKIRQTLQRGPFAPVARGVWEREGDHHEQPS